MHNIFQAVSSFGGQTVRRLLSVSGTVLLLSSSAFSDTATPQTDTAFYNQEFVDQCQVAAQEYHTDWPEVEWQDTMSLSYWSEDNQFHSIVTRGEIDTDRGKATVWGECVWNEDTQRMIVYDFASGPFYHDFMEEPTDD